MGHAAPMVRTRWPRQLSAGLLLWLTLAPPVRAQSVPTSPAEAARERTVSHTTDFSLEQLDRLWQQPGGQPATALVRVLRTQATGNDLEAFALKLPG